MITTLLKSKMFRAYIYNAAFSTSLACCGVYGLVDTSNPYEYDVANSFMLPQIAAGNDQMLVHWALKEQPSRLCIGDNTREIFDPESNLVVAQYTTVPVIGSESLRNGYLNVSFQLPKSIQAGRLGYRARLRYACNWVQKLLPGLFAFNATTPDLFFEVQPRKEMQ